MTREERLAANEARFREINEGTRTLLGVQPASILCECSDRSCVRRIEVEPDEYMRARADDRLFIVRPGHEDPEIESAVDERHGYIVVRKRAELAHVVESR